MPREDYKPVPERKFLTSEEAEDVLRKYKLEIEELKKVIGEYTDRKDRKKYMAWRSAWTKLAALCASEGIYWKDKKTVRINVNNSIQEKNIDDIQLTAVRIPR